MRRVRVVARMLPCIRALRGRPFSPDIGERLARALDEEKIELIIEPDADKRMAAMAEADFFLCENDPLPEDFYERARKLKLIQAGGYFFEKLRIERATRAGVSVMTFPMPITDSVADHTMMMLLALARNFEETTRASREGSDNPPSPRRPDGSAFQLDADAGHRPTPRDAPGRSGDGRHRARRGPARPRVRDGDTVLEQNAAARIRERSARRAARGARGSCSKTQTRSWSA